MAARAGILVSLIEMKPKKLSPAHQSTDLAELVCSNSLRNAAVASAPGLLKAEMRLAQSLIIDAADRCSVPAGGALAVDRERFSQAVQQAIAEDKNIDLVSREVMTIPQTPPPVILATGPLTADALAEDLARLAGREHLHFADATAPIVAADSIDRAIVFEASRWDRGEGYLNCPFNEDQYNAFIDAVLAADKVKLRDFEEPKYFEGCMPIEEMARRGRRTLAFGPMKPVGLTDPRTGRWPYAVVQLRQETRHADLYNLVGFQTRMTWPEQERIFRMIPGLQNAEFHRLGVVHRNTFVCAPELIDARLCLKKEPQVRLAGQLNGVEGYIESAATGWLAGLFAAAQIKGCELAGPPRESAHGCLIAHLTETESKNFQPMNINFGLMPPLEKKMSKGDRKAAYSKRALAAFSEWLEREVAPALPGVLR